MDLTIYQDAINLIVQAGAVSLPLVVACGLVARAFNAIFSAVSGERKIKL